LKFELKSELEFDLLLCSRFSIWKALGDEPVSLEEYSFLTRDINMKNGQDKTENYWPVECLNQE